MFWVERFFRDSHRQEINYFFYPGDLKPPLAVYFSGYRRAEGFEGFGMMRSFRLSFSLVFRSARGWRYVLSGQPGAGEQYS